MAGGLGTLAGRGLEFDEGRTRRSHARFPRRFLQRRWNVLRRFSKAGEFERQLAALDTGRLVIASGQEIKEDRAAQYGPFLLITRPTKKGGGYFEDLTLEVRDVRSFDALWSKPFGKEAPDYWVEPREGTMVLSWPMASKYARGEINSDAGLAKRLETMKEQEGDYFLQVLDAKTGATKGKLLVETGKGSFRIARASPPAITW